MGVGVGNGVAVGAGVGVGLGGGVGVSVRVGVGSGVGVGEGDGVAVGVTIGVGSLVGTGVPVGDSVSITSVGIATGGDVWVIAGGDSVALIWVGTVGGSDVVQATISKITSSGANMKRVRGICGMGPPSGRWVLAIATATNPIRKPYSKKARSLPRKRNCVFQRETRSKGSRVDANRIPLGGRKRMLKQIPATTKAPAIWPGLFFIDLINNPLPHNVALQPTATHRRRQWSGPTTNCTWQ